MVDTAVIYVFNRLLLRKNVVDLKFIVNKREPQNWRFESFCADNKFVSMVELVYAFGSNPKFCRFESY